MSDAALPLNPDQQRRHSWRNMVHTWIIIAGSTALVAFIAWTIFGLTGVIWAAAFGAFGLWSAGKASPKMVLKLYQARPVPEQELRPLHQIMRQLTARADLPTVPQLYYVPSRMLNAFAVGRPEDSAIAVTDGLIRNLNLRQLAGVLAHEVSHVRNGDLKVMALGDVLNRITSFMSMAGLIGFVISIPASFAAGYPVPWLGLLLLLLAPTIGSLLQLALSRAREYDADLDAAGLTGDPEGLASALMVLEKIQGNKNWEAMVLPTSRSPQPSILRSHPKTEDRVERLLSLRQGTSEIAALQDQPEPLPQAFPQVSHAPRVRVARMGLWY